MTETYHQTTYALAQLAECGTPDRWDAIGSDQGSALERAEERAEADPSPGATFLRNVEDAAREAWETFREEWGEDAPYQIDRANDDGAISEIADGAPSCYTVDRWREFTDLAAWDEDPDGYEPDSMTAAAGIALYLIAERLVMALFEEWAEEDATEETDRVADLMESDGLTEDEAIARLREDA